MNTGEPSLLVVGGRQRKNALSLDEWQAYECGLIIQLDCDSGEGKTVVEYVSPPTVCPAELPSIVFKAGDLHREKNRLIVCTQTELIEYDLSSWRQTFYFSHPSFNDVHHVCYRQPADEGKEHLLVANTGLDQVVEIECNHEDQAASKITQQWTACKEETWSRFDNSVDYRQVSTTKPHQSHPNFVFEHQGQVFATRFHQQDAIDMNNPDRTWPISVGNPHDGIVTGNSVCFTTTNGHLVFCNLNKPETRRVMDLNQMTRAGDMGGNELLGWCRGVCLEEEQAWVGFSRIRPTWFRKNLSWIKQGFRSKGEYGTRPTRIVKYDLNRQVKTAEIDLEKFGMNAVFGIYTLS